MIADWPVKAGTQSTYQVHRLPLSDAFVNGLATLDTMS